MNSQSQAIDSGVESFFSSNRTELFQSRLLLWGFSLIGIAISAMRSTQDPFSIGVMSGLFLLIIGILDHFMLRPLRPGQLVIRLSDEGVESSLLSGKDKKLAWDSIKGLTIQAIHDQPCLVFELSPAPGLPDKKHFLTGANPARPTISLAGLDAPAQDRLAESIGQYLRRKTQLTSIDLNNPVRETRQFMEELRALAPIPWVTTFLVAANVIIWITMVFSGAKILASPIPMLFDWGANATSAVQDGQVWRLVSSTFLHGSIFHLFINMAALVGAGMVVERIYGHQLYALIYFGSGIIGSCLSLYFASQTTVAVGASGAIFGVTGALFVAIYQHRKRLPKTFSKQMIVSLSFFITYTVIQSLTKSGIDTAAHLGGLAAGAGLALMLPERLDMDAFIKRHVRYGAAGAGVVLTAAFCLVTFAPAAKIDVEKTIHGSQVVASGMRKFAELLKALEEEEKAVATGRLSIRESDERSRTVYAPKMSLVLEDLRQGYLPPDDPRLPLLNATKRMAELMEESLAMGSVYRPGSDFPEPASPARAEELKQEMLKVMGSLRGNLKDSQKPALD